MQMAAMILGILGGFIGFGESFFDLFLDSSRQTLGIYDAGTYRSLGMAAIPLSILAIVGATTVISSPKKAGILMIIYALGGFIVISSVYIIGGLMLIIAGILSLTTAK